MAKKVAAKAATKQRVKTLRIGGLLYETNDIRVGDRVTIECTWHRKPAKKRKFKIIDIDRVVIADAEGRTAVVSVSDSGLTRLSDD